MLVDEERICQATPQTSCLHRIPSAHQPSWTDPLERADSVFSPLVVILLPAYTNRTFVPAFVSTVKELTD